MSEIVTSDRAPARDVRRPLQILILEDVPEDAILIEAALRRGGLEFRANRVDTREEFEAELKYRRPDLILSDHGFPAFDGFTAMSLAKRHAPGIPFIFVTGAPEGDAETRARQQGAFDFISKEQLGNLVTAVRRAARARPRPKEPGTGAGVLAQAHGQLHTNPPPLRRSSRLVPVCCSCKSVRDEQGQWRMEDEAGLDLAGAELSHGICPACLKQLYPEFA